MNESQTVASPRVAPSPQRKAPAPFLSVTGLTMKTPLGAVYENVSLTAQKGQAIAIFGEERCGKTSLLLGLTGRMRCRATGSSKVGGFDLVKQARKVRLISSMSVFRGVNDPQADLKLTSLVGAELRLVGRHAGKKRVMAYLEDWGFADQASLRFRELSAYDAVRFGIALGCASDPALLVVDDIQSNLTQHESIKLADELVLLAQTHDMAVLFGCNEYDIARHADGVVLLSKGAMLQRRAVMRDMGLAQDCPVVGTGNGVVFQDEAASQEMNENAGATISGAASEGEGGAQ